MITQAGRWFSIASVRGPGAVIVGTIGSVTNCVIQEAFVLRTFRETVGFRDSRPVGAGLTTRSS